MHAVAVFVCFVVFVAFNERRSLTQVCGFQTLIFIARVLRFVFYIVRISDQGCFEMYSQSNLLDRMLRQHPYQPCPQDFFTNIQYNPQDGMLRILLLIGGI